LLIGGFGIADAGTIGGSFVSFVFACCAATGFTASGLTSTSGTAAAGWTDAGLSEVAPTFAAMYSFRIASDLASGALATGLVWDCGGKSSPQAICPATKLAAHSAAVHHRCGRSPVRVLD